MDPRIMKYSKPNSLVVVTGATSAGVRPVVILAMLAMGVVSIAHAAPTGPQQEVAGKIAGEAPKPEAAMRTTPPAKFSTTSLSDKTPPLKLDTDFASAKRIVPFAVNKVGVGPRGTLAVRELLPLAKQADKVYVRGRTDGSGTTPANRKVAHDRAYTVFKVFRNGGVERKKLRLTYCTNCFIASNDTEEGRKLNRRVEVELIMPREEIARLPKPVHAPEAPPTLPLASSTRLRMPPR